MSVASNTIVKEEIVKSIEKSLQGKYSIIDIWWKPQKKIVLFRIIPRQAVENEHLAVGTRLAAKLES